MSACLQPDSGSPVMARWLEPGVSHVDVSLRCPTYRENSHANHTWDPRLRQSACFSAPEAPPAWVRFPSPAPLPGNGRPRRGMAWGQGIDPMGKSWEFDAQRKSGPPSIFRPFRMIDIKPP